MSAAAPRPARARARVTVSERRTSRLALAIFLATYVGILAVIFAPKSTFVAAPATSSSER